MAKVILGNIDPTATPLTKEGVVIRSTKWGPIAQAWPRKRPEEPTPYQVYTREEFKIAARWAANPLELEYETAVNLVKGTEMVPRDFLIRCMYGNGYVFVQEDGTESTRFRDVAPNPQYVLDLVTSDIGSILWRAPEGWIWIEAGSVGDVLTWTTAGPQWLPAAVASGVSALGLQPSIVNPNAVTVMGLNLFSGAIQYFPAGAVFNAVQFYCSTTVPTTVIKAAIYSRDTANAGALMNEGTASAGTVPGLNHRRLNGTITITVPGFYYIGCQITVANISQANTNSTAAKFQVAAAGALPATFPNPTQGYVNTMLTCWPVLVP